MVTGASSLWLGRKRAGTDDWKVHSDQGECPVPSPALKHIISVLQCKANIVTCETYMSCAWLVNRAANNTLLLLPENTLECGLIPYTDIHW